MEEPHFQDLVTDTCPLGCNTCSRIYVNELIGHRILCKCKSCSHGNQNSDKSGQMSTLTSESADTPLGLDLGVMQHG
jgi:hypothetical protein